MYKLAQVTQTHALVARVLLAKLGEDTPQRVVAVVVVFELLQCSEQGVPAAFGNANGEHDEKAVKTCFFHHHTVLSQKFGHDGSRYA